MWDCGDGTLLVKKSGREERIDLSNVIDVAGPSHANPPIVRLTLRAPGVFGREVAFLVKPRIFPFGRDAIVDGLIARTEAARQLSRGSA